jgi:hypothetical protein
LCLSQERVKHIKNWRAHLKPERLRCNSSLSFPRIPVISSESPALSEAERVEGVEKSLSV